MRLESVWDVFGIRSTVEILGVMAWYAALFVTVTVGFMHVHCEIWGAQAAASSKLIGFTWSVDP